MNTRLQIPLIILLSAGIAVTLLVPSGAIAALVLALVVPLFLLARRAPHISICLTLVFLCLEQFIISQLSPEAILFLKVLPDVVLLTVLLAIGDRVFLKGRRSNIGIAIVTSAVVMVCVSAVTNGIGSDDWLYYGRKVLRYVPLVLIAPVAFEQEAHKKVFRNVLVIITIMQVMVGLLQLFGGEAAYHFFRPTIESLNFGEHEVPVSRRMDVIEGTRLVGTMGTYMDFGLLLLLSWCFLLPWAADRSVELSVRARSIVLLAIVSCCLLLSFSRMSILGAMCALGVFLMQQRKWTTLTVFAVGCTLLVLVPFLTADVVTSSAERATRLADRIWASYSFDYLDVRRYARASLLFALAPAVLTESPLFGIGPGFSRINTLSLPSLPLFMDDNGYVSLLVQYGLFGVGLFMSLMTWLLHSLAKAWGLAQSALQRRTIASLIIYLSALLVVNFLANVLSIRYVSFAFWLCCGMAVGIIADLRPPPISESPER